MSNFSDLLNKPLPSKAKAEDVVTESTCENEDVMDTPVVTNEEDEIDVPDGSDDDISTTDVDDIATDNDDFDPDSLSDEDLAALDAELSGDAVDAVAGADDEDNVALSPEEEIQADDMMKVAATTLLVNDELNAEERASFVESADATIAIDEGFMTDADINEMSVELGLATENSYNKKMLIRLDAESKKKQLFALGVNVSAAAHHDPDYVKLKKVMKMRKVLRARLTQKYKSEATKRMKVYFNRLKKSKAAPLAKIGSKMDK